MLRLVLRALLVVWLALAAMVALVVLLVLRPALMRGLAVLQAPRLVFRVPRLVLLARRRLLTLVLRALLLLVTLSWRVLKMVPAVLSSSTPMR